MQTKTTRRPGEVVFIIVILAASLFLLFSAYGISGFESLSSAGAVPMVTTGAMVVCGVLILVDALRKSPAADETVAQSILPPMVIVTILAIAAYALLLKPVGFIPTSFLFLLGLMKVYSRRSLGFCIATAAGSVAAIYIIFRLIFSVLMPAGLVPEGEILAWITLLFTGAK